MLVADTWFHNFDKTKIILGLFGYKESQYHGFKMKIKGERKKNLV